MNFYMMPSAPARAGDKEERSFSECTERSSTRLRKSPGTEFGRTSPTDLEHSPNVIEMVIHTNMFEEFYTPDGIISFRWPVGA